MMFQNAIQDSNMEVECNKETLHKHFDYILENAVDKNSFVPHVIDTTFEVNKLAQLEENVAEGEMLIIHPLSLAPPARGSTLFRCGPPPRINDPKASWSLVAAFSSWP